MDQTLRVPHRTGAGAAVAAGAATVGAEREASRRRGEVELLFLDGRRPSAPREELLSRILETVSGLVPASFAAGLMVDEERRVDRVIVHGVADRDAREAAACLLRRLRTLEPIDPFAPARAERLDAKVLSPDDVGGLEHVKASMYGRHLHKAGFAPPVVTYFSSEGTVVAAVALLRTVDAPAFRREEVRLLLGLQPFLEAALVCTADERPGAEEDALTAGGLTRRERDVVALVATGMSNAAVAEALRLTEPTVKTHLTRAYAKLGIRSRTQLAIMVARDAAVHAGAPARAAGAAAGARFRRAADSIAEPERA